jgi:hypothetical protein
MNQQFYLANFDIYSDRIDSYDEISLIFTILLFVFLWFEVFKIYNENSQNEIVLEYKFAQLKEKKNLPNLMGEENKDDILKEKMEKKYYWIRKIKIWNKFYYFIIVLPSLFWFTSKRLIHYSIFT